MSVNSTLHAAQGALAARRAAAARFDAAATRRQSSSRRSSFDAASGGRPLQQQPKIVEAEDIVAMEVTVVGKSDGGGTTWGVKSRRTSLRHKRQCSAADQMPQPAAFVLTARLDGGARSCGGE